MRIGILVAVFCGLLPSFSASSQVLCDPLSYYNTNGQEVVYRHAVPTPWFAVRMSAEWVATVDTAYIGMGVERGPSSGSRPDTLEVRVLGNQLPSVFVLDQFLALVTPNIQGQVPDAMYIIEFIVDSPIAWVGPMEDFYLAWRVRGPSGDIARTLMVKPALEPLRSVVINPNNSTTLATDFMRTQLQLAIPDSVEFKSNTHVCWPNGKPVELTAFTARYADGAAVLEWLTATEVNNSGFSIERLAATSDLGSMRLWQRIGFVTGNGTTTEAQSYAFIDPRPEEAADSEGLVHYRLRQIDYDGTAETFPEVEIRLPISAEFTLDQSYPNPVQATAGSAIVTFNLPTARTARLELFDALGRSLNVVADRNFPAGKHSLDIPVGGLRSGLYFYRLTSSGKTLTRRLTVVE